MTKARLKKIGKIVGISALALLLTFAIVPKTIDWVCIAPEPELRGTPKILSEEPRVEGDRTILGKSWMAERDGVRLMYLDGDPFTIGYTNATLTSDLIKELEDSLLRTVDEFIPSYVKKWLLGKYVLIRMRRLPEFVPDEFKMEILGLSRGYRDYHPEIAPLYHRLLNYHAAHDISHAVMDNPLVGCTSFAAWGEHVQNEHLIVGRNFDFEAGPSFDVNKLVVFFRPREGHAFISVSWPSMLGVVSGINDQRLYVSINAGHSSDDKTVGTPVCFVTRQVLQYASSLEEAIEIVKKARVFVSDAFLIADGKTGKAVVVEKSPGRCVVRQPEGDYLICSNHFLTEAFTDDPANRGYMKSGTSAARHERMQELVARSAGSMDVLRAAAILRDRRGRSDADIGNGNRTALNPLIATHSVIADVTAGVIWVSASPHQLGTYVPFSIADFAATPQEPTVPEDPFLADGGYEGYLKSEELLTRGMKLIDQGGLREAERVLRESAELNPSYYLILMELGRAALLQGRTHEAHELLTEAMSSQPAFSKDREEITNLLEQAKVAGR